MGYVSPNTISEALEALAEREMIVLAGGTDIFPALPRSGPDHPILDISRVDGLSEIGPTEDGGWRIGAGVTWSEILKTPLPPAFDGLKAAAKTIGSVQIQNTATVMGNICNASPAADGVPPLLTLDAKVEVCTHRERRILDLQEFVLDVRKTALEPSELATAILVPPQSDRLASAFQKLGTRSYLVISIAMVAIAVGFDADGLITDLRIAAGSCAPVARRLHQLEAALVGHDLAGCGPLIASHDYAADGLAPISDVRGTAQYRMEALGALIDRALQDGRRVDG